MKFISPYTVSYHRIVHSYRVYPLLLIFLIIICVIVILCYCLCSFSFRLFDGVGGEVRVVMRVDRPFVRSFAGWFWVAVVELSLLLLLAGCCGCYCYSCHCCWGCWFFISFVYVFFMLLLALLYGILATLLLGWLNEWICNSCLDLKCMLNEDISGLFGVVVGVVHSMQERFSRAI